MPLLDDLAEALARDTLAAMDELGDDRFYMEVSKVLGAASPTVQEAYLTSVRFLMAERRGRKFLDQKLAAHRGGGTAPTAPHPADSGH
ncbi:MAG: hypothetical protein IE927_11585 [Rhodobacterales bacterium]|nr:hypothetical protein [Rhodobacterales bacterium]